MKGIIYKIVCNETGEVYYGSTTQSLNNRMICHKSGCKAWKLGNAGHSTSYNIIDRGNYAYVLIEAVECENKHQLHERERFYIQNNECINHVIPTRTDKEYYEANKENLKERCKIYKQTNTVSNTKIKRINGEKQIKIKSKNKQNYTENYTKNI